MGRRHSAFATNTNFEQHNKPKPAFSKIKHDRAIVILDKKLKFNTRQIEAMMYKGVELLNANKTEEAIKVLKELTSKYRCEKSKSAFILLAVAYSKNKQQEKAVEVLDEVLKYCKSYAEALIVKGNLLIDEKKWIEAKECFHAAIRGSKKVATAYLGLANCEYNLSKLKEADTAYMQAIHLGAAIPHERNISSNRVERLNMARVKLKLGNEAAAQEIIEDIFNDLPNNDLTIARALLIKGRIMEKLNNLTDAAMNYEQAANYGCTEISTAALYKLAKLRVREKDYYEAYFNVRRIQVSKAGKKVKTLYNLVDGVFFAGLIDCVLNEKKNQSRSHPIC
eukprot:TRINITY_DN26212_c0_g1_i1.p1 TRINITY_DN26212_c0_g1~~TRINITY_DN26212_c0_g1_i1.p1  ORF type:complete len:337 (-),score=59.71 TRINITY_DN26212_c0_g1_i1:371-1381(-)